MQRQSPVVLGETLNKDLKQYLSQWAFRICGINGRHILILNLEQFELFPVGRGYEVASFIYRILLFKYIEQDFEVNVQLVLTGL